MGEITREEYNESIGRIHEKVNLIATDTKIIAKSAERLDKFSEDIHRVIYGNGKTGLSQMITTLFERVSLHTKLVLGMITAILGLAFFIIRSALVK